MDEALAFVLAFAFATDGSGWPHRRWSADHREASPPGRLVLVVVFEAQVRDQVCAHNVPKRVLQLH
jgi:hypothetical protein